MKTAKKWQNTRSRHTWDSPKEHFYEALESPWHILIGQLNASIIETTHEFYKEKNMMPVMLPLTCQSVSSPMGLGSDSLPVEIKLHGQKTYLADSMQFYLEYILRQTERGVYYIMPSFRGEEPDARHLNEFFHSEAEIIGDLDKVMTLVEDYLVALTDNILLVLSDELQNVVGDTQHLIKFLNRSDRLPSIQFSEAQMLLGKSEKYFKEIAPGIWDINKQGEMKLIQIFGGYVWLTHIPKLITPFYQATDSTGKYSLAADLLMGIGETVGCGQRHTYAIDTLKALKEHQVNPQNYKWYLELKEYYPIQTAGFGLGIERFLLWVLKHGDIRDIPTIPRIKGMPSYL